jgi:hypothetical protein
MLDTNEVRLTGSVCHMRTTTNVAGEPVVDFEIFQQLPGAVQTLALRALATHVADGVKEGSHVLVLARMGADWEVDIDTLWVTGAVPMAGALVGLYPPPGGGGCQPLIGGPMSARAILKDWAERYDVSLEDQFDAVMTYIDFQGDPDAFLEYADIDDDDSAEDQLEGALDYITRQDSDDAFADSLEMYAIDRDLAEIEDEDEQAIL